MNGLANNMPEKAGLMADADEGAPGEDAEERGRLLFAQECEFLRGAATEIGPWYYGLSKPAWQPPPLAVITVRAEPCEGLMVNV